ncbi:hypothetical protein EUTSA_v10002195mg [Eutrema salsugineum]|uniref:DUF7746 domain-containing protein n=1 Tax=Eutrema salsugineum TaxID=72664 RepID=V4LHT7_EUTSA|nr:hypothetical protein EUTSA_v10002195mg [Eutrema salsugineum]
MTMAANAYRTQVGNEDIIVAEVLISGFSGQLKGCITILDNFGNLQQDALATLVIAITLHFIGDPSVLRDKNAELLSNLKCKRLSDFQWYKNTFPTREKKFEIKSAYGELISIVQQEGPKICQDLNLQKHLKWELKEQKPRKHSWQRPQKKFTSKEIPTNKPFYKNLTCHYKKVHISKLCRFNRKIQELGFGEELSSKISNLLLYHSSSSVNDSDSSLFSEKAVQVDELKNSSIGSKSDEKKINVLTKDQEFQIEILNSISNP